MAFFSCIMVCDSYLHLHLGGSKKSDDLRHSSSSSPPPGAPGGSQCPGERPPGHLWRGRQSPGQQKSAPSGGRSCRVCCCCLLLRRRFAILPPAASSISRGIVVVVVVVAPTLAEATTLAPPEPPNSTALVDPTCPTFPFLLLPLSVCLAASERASEKKSLLSSLVFNVGITAAIFFFFISIPFPTRTHSGDVFGCPSAARV